MKKIDEKQYEDILQQPRDGQGSERCWLKYEDLQNCTCHEVSDIVKTQAKIESEQKRLCRETLKAKEDFARKLKEFEERYSKLQEKQENAVTMIQELDVLKDGLLLSVEKQTLMIEFLASKLENAGWQYDQIPYKKCTDAKGWIQKAKDTVYK